MAQLLIFGMGYTARRFAGRMQARGWEVVGTSRASSGDQIAFDDVGAVLAAVRSATHILSSVPPTRAGDPVLRLTAEAGLQRMPPGPT